MEQVSRVLKIIAGSDIVDAGTVTLRNGIRLGYLSQEPNFDKSITIAQLIQRANTEVMSLISAYEAAQKLNRETLIRPPKKN